MLPRIQQDEQNLKRLQDSLRQTLQQELQADR